MTKRFTTIAVLSLILLPVAAQAADPGRTVLSFLKLGVDARATAMGEAYVAVAGDAAASYWNPAGLLRIEKNDVLGMHNAWVQDLRHDFVGAALHRGRHAAGISFIGLFTDDLERRDDTGKAGGSFGYSDVSVSGSYAFQVTQDIGLGATVRYLRESIDNQNLSGFAYDFGGYWDTPLDHLTAAASLRNLGGQMSFDFEGAGSFDLPTTLQAGLAYTFPDLAGGRLLLASDFVAASGDDGSFHAGAEYAIKQVFLIGAGIKTGLDNENVSFGLGYDNNVRLHYAFTPLDSDLGNAHRFSLGYAW